LDLFVAVPAYPYCAAGACANWQKRLSKLERLMTVYVDECQEWPNGKGLWCHMATDDPAGVSELHRLAAYIGMKRAWFQNRPNLPHYDLRPSMRAKAIAKGAVAVSSVELVRRCRRPMLGGNGTPPAAPPPDAPRGNTTQQL
jgi:hypothetical protein